MKKPAVIQIIIKMTLLHLPKNVKHQILSTLHMSFFFTEMGVDGICVL